MDELAIAEVLERAADLIVIDGWMQGSWGSPGGPRCAEGHLHSAVNEHFREQRSSSSAPFCSIYDKAWSMLFDRLDEAVTDWNDKSGRTAGEVRDLFLSTAKDIRNGLDGATNPKEPSL